MSERLLFLRRHKSIHYRVKGTEIWYGKTLKLKQTPKPTTNLNSWKGQVILSFFNKWTVRKGEEWTLLGTTRDLRTTAAERNTQTLFRFWPQETKDGPSAIGHGVREVCMLGGHMWLQKIIVNGQGFIMPFCCLLFSIPGIAESWLTYLWRNFYDAWPLLHRNQRLYG